MYARLLKKPLTVDKSFFLFGPRGTGKTYWLKSQVPDGLYIDLLESSQYNSLLAAPQRLAELIPPQFNHWVIIDEVQKIPSLLDEVHRLIEQYHYKFIVTGSSARSLKQQGVNLLAGRALTYNMHPLTALELGDNFDLERSLNFGNLPSIPQEADPHKFLTSYVKTYLYQEVLQESMTRNIANFARFLESASFSQGCPLNMAAIARDCHVHQKVVSAYFDILDDLLIGYRLPVFHKRAKRRLVRHPKFYFFDTGIFRTIRPQGPLDPATEIAGAALETLLLQELRAINDYYEFDYTLSYWRTNDGHEVDFILYGPRGMHAFEVKHAQRLTKSDFRSLKALHKDYPMAKLFLIYGGDRAEYHGDIRVLPIRQALFELPDLLQ